VAADLGPVPAEEAAAVKPVGLLPVKEGRLDHGREPHVSLGNFRLAALALGSARLGVLRPVTGTAAYQYLAILPSHKEIIKTLTSRYRRVVY
jgi:hypothetical protein